MKTKGEIMGNKGRDNSGKTMKIGSRDRSEITKCMLKNYQQKQTPFLLRFLAMKRRTTIRYCGVG